MKISHLFICVFALAAMISCRQDSEIFTPDPPEREGLTTIIGQIVDANHQPIGQVDVRSGVILTQTDDNGVFRLESVKTQNSKAYVRALKPGYHHASRLHLATDREDNFVRIVMLELESIGSFNATDGGMVRSDEDVILSFPPGSIVTSTGIDYTGEVDVNFAYLDPNDEYFSDKMPGNLIGVDQSDFEQLLVSYGMLSVELQGSSGQSLDIKSGSQVTIDAPIPAGLTPDNLRIPLWSFDETLGLWQEESAATVDVDRMVGMVSHFSWWNFDLPSPMVQICMQLLLEDGTVASNVSGCLTREAGVSGKQTSCGSTDANGEFKARVPVDEELTLEIKDPCGQVMFMTTVGPFTQDGNEPPITIPAAQVNSMIVTGTLVDCGGGRVNNGYIVYNFGDGARSLISYVDDGIIADTLMICDTEDFAVYGVDIDNIAQTTTGTYTTQATVNVDNIIACEEVLEFVEFTYTIDGEEQKELFTQIVHTFGDDDRNNVTNENRQDTSGFFSLQFMGTEPGTQPSSNLYLFYDIESELQCENSLELTITSYGEIGEYIEGTFTADECFVVRMGEPDGTSPVTGSFRVIRGE